MAAGSGKSTPPQLKPLSVEKYPRIGSRKISLEPAASCRGRSGLMAMKVSLCGPHSLETSTFEPADEAAAAGASGLGPLLSKYWYLSHQVGPFATGAASAEPNNETASTMDATNMWNPSGMTSRVEPYTRPAPEDQIRHGTKSVLL